MYFRNAQVYASTKKYHKYHGNKKLSGGNKEPDHVGGRGKETTGSARSWRDGNPQVGQGDDTSEPTDHLLLLFYLPAFASFLFLLVSLSYPFDRDCFDEVCGPISETGLGREKNSKSLVAYGMLRSCVADLNGWLMICICCRDNAFIFVALVQQHAGRWCLWTNV